MRAKNANKGRIVAFSSGEINLWHSAIQAFTNILDTLHSLIQVFTMPQQLAAAWLRAHKLDW
jgi:hypothetical protein